MESLCGDPYVQGTNLIHASHLQGLQKQHAAKMAWSQYLFCLHSQHINIYTTPANVLQSFFRIVLSLWIHFWISIACNVGCEGQHLTSPGRPGILLRGIVGWLEKCQLFRALWKIIKFFQMKMNHHHSDQSQQIQSNLFVPESHFPKIGFLSNFTQTSNIEKDQSTLSVRRSRHTKFQSIYHP